MMQIQLMSSEAIRMQTYGSAPNRAKMLVEKPPVQSDDDTFVAITSVRPNPGDTVSVLTPSSKIPKAEEIEKMIQNNGYPFKTDIYKAIVKIIENEMN